MKSNLSLTFKMRLVFLLGLLALVAAASGENVEPQRFYHEAVGIPEAARIKASEEEILARTAADDKNAENRIVGGAVAPVNSYPYLGGLVISLVGISGNSACGSSLVSASRLVTAAHCWFDGRNQGWQFVVVLGSQFLFFGGTRIATSQVFVHPQWTPSNLQNDVAVIYLPTSVFLNPSIQPISLPSGTQLWDTFAGWWGLAAGYGRTSDQQAGVSTQTQISHVGLQVITHSQCLGVFGPTYIHQSTICTNGAGGVGICGGDSGGPLVINQNGQPILVGISSFVAQIGCQLGYPSAFARVTSFSSFIVQHL